MNIEHEWSATGMTEIQAQAFAQDMASIQAMKIFIAALPIWAKRHNTGVNLKIFSDPAFGDGVGIDMAFTSPSVSVGAGEDLIDLLKEQNHLWELGLVIDKMRELGCDSDVINILVDEANTLADKIAASMKG